MKKDGNKKEVRREMNIYIYIYIKPKELREHNDTLTLIRSEIKSAIHKTLNPLREKFPPHKNRRWIYT